MKNDKLITLFVILITLLILVGTLVVRSDFPVIGGIPMVFGWILVVVAAAGVVYALYPMFKPAFPELKKISWLTGSKLVGNIIRVFLFILIFTLLFLLYVSFIQQILSRIFK